MNCRLYRVDCIFDNEVRSSTGSTSTNSKSIKKAAPFPSLNETDLATTPREQSNVQSSKETPFQTQYTDLLTPDLSEFELHPSNALASLYQDAAFAPNPSFWIPEAHLLSTMDLAFPATPTASDLTSPQQLPLTWEQPQRQSTSMDLSVSSNSYKATIDIDAGSDENPGILGGANLTTDGQRSQNEPRQGLFLRKGKSDTKFLGMDSD